MLQFWRCWHCLDANTQQKISHDAISILRYFNEIMAFTAGNGIWSGNFSMIAAYPTIHPG
jgi:hypothetical protein